MTESARGSAGEAAPPAQHSPPLLLVAHGTASTAGTRTTWRLRDAVAAVRPEVPVRLCFLEQGSPSLAEVLADEAFADESSSDTGLGATVIVPLLLSTGYHVRVDIPAAVAGRSDVVVARHLGPHDLLTDALVDRLGESMSRAPVVLAAAGSRQPEAAAELAEAAELLGSRLAAPVRVLTMGEPLAARLAEVAGAGQVRVATYLLTEGQFVDALASAAPGGAEVAPPLGTHPAVVALVWLRYGDAVAARGR